MEDYYMVEEIAWGAERGKSFHLCLTSFCEISQDLVGWFLLVCGLCSVLVCVGLFCFWDGLVKILHSISTSSFHVSSSWPTMLRARSAMQEEKKHFKRVYLRQDDFDRFGYSAGCKACAFIRQGLDRQGIPHEDCRTRIVQRLQETEYGRKRIEIAKKEEDFKSEPEKKQRIEAPEIRPSISASGSGVKHRAEDVPTILDWFQKFLRKHVAQREVLKSWMIWRRKSRIYF